MVEKQLEANIIFTPKASSTEETLLKQLEYAGRLCYKSRDKITDDSYIPFIKGIIKRGHNSVLEMAQISCIFNPDQVSCQHHWFTPVQMLEMFNIKSYKLIVKRGDYSDLSDEHTLRQKLIFTGSVLGWRKFILYLHKVNNEDFCYLTSILRKTMILEFKTTFPNIFSDIEVDTNEETSHKALIYFFKTQCPNIKEIDSVFKCRKKINHDNYKKLKGWIKDNQKYGIEFLMDRSTSHELVRHRLVSYLQESQRYCRYDKHLEFINFNDLRGMENQEQQTLISNTLNIIEETYQKLLKECPPEVARKILPNCLSTRIIAYADWKEWKYIYKLRSPKAADPTMRRVMKLVYDLFNKEGIKINV